MLDIPDRSAPRAGATGEPLPLVAAGRIQPQQPPEGSLVEVADGIFWARMPLPFALDHVNVWLLRDGKGFTLIDTGMADARTRGLWERIFAEQLGGLPITRLICTHHHPDHMGLSSWFHARFGVRMTATIGEWTHGRLGWLESGEDFLAHASDHFVRFGLRDEPLRLAIAEGNNYRKYIDPIPLDFVRIGDGDRLSIGGREWRVLTFSGHSPEQVCLWCPEADVLISGDQVLPRISPTIGVWSNEPEANPLGGFFASLDRLMTLSDDALVLPSHGLPFTGLRQRCKALKAHHDERLKHTLDSCGDPSSGADVMERLFPRTLSGHDLLFAVAETLSHLNYLIAEGCIEYSACEKQNIKYKAK
jgi:glyoxylase-like metal-dependent hydrolase (beta-lactamase superfamily II)